MEIIIALSMLELVLWLEVTWSTIHKVLPPVIRIPALEVVSTGDGFVLLLGGEAVTIL